MYVYIINKIIDHLNRHSNEKKKMLVKLNLEKKLSIIFFLVFIFKKRKQNLIVVAVYMETHYHK